MGLSLGDFLKGVAQGAVGLATGGPVGAGVGFGQALVSGARDNQNNPWIPDVLEQYYAPERFETQPANGGGAVNCDVPQVMVSPMQKVIHKAPKGYVIVECPPGSGQKVAMLKPVARHYGLWKPRKKPPISVRDWNCLNRADRTIKKLETVQKKADNVGKKRRR